MKIVNAHDEYRSESRNISRNWAGLYAKSRFYGMAVKRSYEESAEIQAEYSIVDAFIEDALEEITELELSANTLPDEIRYRVVISPVGRYVRTSSLSQSNGSTYIQKEILQRMDNMALWETWSFEHRSKSIVCSQERTPRYREYERMDGVDSVVVFNWLSASRMPEKGSTTDSLISRLLRDEEYRDPDGNLWKLRLDQVAQNATLMFSYPDEDEGVYTYEYDLSRDEARLIRREIRRGNTTEIWAYEYRKHCELYSDGQLYRVTHISYPDALPKKHAGRIDRQITILREVPSSQWDVQQAIDKMLSKYSAYSFEKAR